MSRSDCCACTLWRRAGARLQKEMATYRQWSVSLWRDPDDVSHCRILSPDKTEWRLIWATLCRWGRCFMADQLWFMTRIREEEESLMYAIICSHTQVTGSIYPVTDDNTNIYGGQSHIICTHSHNHTFWLVLSEKQNRFVHEITEIYRKHNKSPIKNTRSCQDHWTSMESVNGNTTVLIRAKAVTRGCFGC